MLFTISTIFFFFISIIISQFIIDPNLKIAYWLMLLLVYISLSNIYMSIYFYNKLRAQPGLRGERGDSGEQGARGSDGVCIVQPECGIIDYNKMIKDLLRTLDENYDNILTKDTNGIMLEDEEKQIKSSIEDYVHSIQTLAENEKWTLPKLKEQIKNTFNN
jgi:hypothetical protein